LGSRWRKHHKEMEGSCKYTESQSQIANTGWSSCLGVGWETNNSSP